MEDIILEQTITRDIHGTLFNKKLLITTMLLGSFVSILNQTILTTALPQIMGYFRINAIKVQWLTTAFLLVNAIMIPLTALLIEKFSNRQLFVFSMSMFGSGTILCAISPGFHCLLIGRIIQAIGAGIMAPLVNTLLLLIFPREKRGAAMGIYGLVISFAPAIGPTLAGFILEKWSWHYLFYILIPIIALDILLAVFFMKDIIPLNHPKIDVPSIILSTVGFGSLLYGFSNAGTRGFSDPHVLVTIIIGSISVFLFISRQTTMESPMLELRVFSSKTFTITTIIGSILNIASVGAGMIVPIYLQTVLGISALSSGLVLLPGALSMAPMMFISGRLFDQYGVKKLAISGISLLLIGSVPFANLNLSTPTWYITLLYTIRYIGISLVIMPMQTAGMNALPNKLLAHASASVNMSKQVAASLGTALLITVMSNVATMHSPNDALATINPASYKSAVLTATLTGMNMTFILIIALTFLAFILSFLLKPNKMPFLMEDFPLKRKDSI